MGTRVLALLDDDDVADQAAKEITDLGYEDLEWQFVNSDRADVRIMPGFAGQSGAGMARPVGFVQETDAPDSFSLDGLDLSDAEKEFYAHGIEGDAILIVVDAPDEAVDQVEQILLDHNAGRFMET